MLLNQAFEYVVLLEYDAILPENKLYLRISVKNMKLSYGVKQVFDEDIPKLMHGNDGLIYTCLQSPYVVGTDRKMCVAFVLFVPLS